MRLYLDVETYREGKESAFTSEKIVAIGIIEDWSEYSSELLSKPVEFKYFAEWKLESEEAVVKGFYNYLRLP